MRNFRRLLLGLMLLSLAGVSWGEEMTFFCSSNVNVTVNKGGELFEVPEQSKIKFTLNKHSASFHYSSSGAVRTYQVDRFEVEDGNYLLVQGSFGSNGLFSMDHDYKAPEFPLVSYYQLGSFGYMTQYSCTKF